MTRKLIARYILLVMILIWMSVIYIFSSQNGTGSASCSGGITEMALKTFYPSYGEMSEKNQSIIFDKANFLIRKTAHFTEYGVLAVLVTFFLLSFDMGINGVIISTVVFCCAFAFGDEFHQMFVAGRSSQIRDVCIDTLGAAAGSTVSSILAQIRRRRKER